MEQNHGGDWYSFTQEYGTMPLDFSASISPLGLPEGVKNAISNELTKAPSYPDPQCRALGQKLAGTLGLLPQQILCGNGASDLLYRLVLAKQPKRALVTAPTFTEYRKSLDLVSCQVRAFNLSPEQDFRINENILSQITPDLDLVILCEPNNPTGVTTPMPLLLAILERCTAMGVLMMADECFNGLLDEPERHSLKPQIPSHPHLLVIDAFTKAYAMAGLRLGYAMSSNESLLSAMEQAGPPWSVSSVSQSAGIAALEDTDYLPRLHGLLQAERIRLKAALKQLGCRVTEGEANYLLFFCNDVSLTAKLRAKGILIRDCRSFDRLKPGYYRIAVRTTEENNRLIAAIREVLSNG